MVGRFLDRIILGRWCNLEQPAGKRQAGVAGRAGEQTVMADAVEPARQDMEQEAADKLVGRKGHDPLALRAVALETFFKVLDQLFGKAQKVMLAPAVCVTAVVAGLRFAAARSAIGSRPSANALRALAASSRACASDTSRGMPSPFLGAGLRRPPQKPRSAYRSAAPANTGRCHPRAFLAG